MPAATAEPQRGLATINGEGDGSSVSSSILQRLWPAVLLLAKDVAAGPGLGQESRSSGSGAEPPLTPISASSSSTNIRRCAAGARGGAGGGGDSLRPGHGYTAVRSSVLLYFMLNLLNDASK